MRLINRFCRPLLALALAIFVQSVHAADVKWQDRGDRYEGIRPVDVSGGEFRLLGVHVEPGPRSRGAPRLYLSVPLRETTELEVRVWEPDSGYRMVPKQKTFEPGDSFSWLRAMVLAPRDIEADQLYVLASAADPLEPFFYPARLTTSEPPSGVERYVFRFHSGGGVGLDVTIAREVEGRLEAIREVRRDERYGGALDFSWDGRDAANRAVPAGIYHLGLKGTVYLRTDREIDVDIPFIHHATP